MSSKIHGLSGTYCNFQGLSRPRIFLFLNLRTFKVQFSVKKKGLGIQKFMLTLTVKAI